MDTAFVLLAHEGSEIYHLVLRTVCRLSDRNVSFKKQLCSPVAAPWNCVVDRDIHLLKAHSCCRSFSSNCVQDAAPKSSSGYGFELTIIILCHLSYFSERPDLCNTYTYNSNMQGCKYPNNTPNKVGVTGSLHVPTCPYMFVNVSVKAFRNGIPYITEIFHLWV